MSAAVRRTPARRTPAPASVQNRATASALPAYEPPTFPLDPAAQRALAQLIESHSLNKLEKKLAEAQANIAVTAGEINDRLTSAEQTVAKRKRKRIEQDAGSEEPDTFEQGLDGLRDKVERMTQRMDENVRRLIDGQHGVQAIKESIAVSADNARANASTQASTQSRRPPRHAAAGDGDDEDQGHEDEEYQDFTPTDPTSGTQANPTAVETFNTKLDNAKTRYQSHNLTARYSANNDYVNFKRVVHDARFPDGETQLAHPSAWFAEEGEAPAPGMTTRGRANAEDDDDDDIAVSRTKISTKCPLTLQEFKKPVTSAKCPHSFESEAITGMIDASATRVGGQPGARGQTVGGEKAVQCPVGGCREMLTKADLHVDAVLIRQIKRLQRAKELEEEDADEEEDGGGAPGRSNGKSVLIDDDGDDEDGADVDTLVERQTQMKAESRDTAATSHAPAASTAPRRSAQVDLDQSGNEDEDEGGNEEADENGDATMED